MRAVSRLKPVFALTMAGVLLLSATGCDLLPDDIASEVIAFLEEWADAHDVNPQTPGGAVNLAKRAASGSTGDDEVDAILGAFGPLDEIKKADEEMDEGRQLRASGKLSEAADKMDDAIAARPQDYTYRVERAGLAFQAGDRRVARRELAKVDDLSPPLITDEDGFIINRTLHQQFYTDIIDELESSAIDPAAMERDTKREYYRQLRDAYSSRSGLWLGNEPLYDHDQERYRYYEDMYSKS